MPTPSMRFALLLSVALLLSSSAFAQPYDASRPRGVPDSPVPEASPPSFGQTAPAAPTTVQPLPPQSPLPLPRAIYGNGSAVQQATPPTTPLDATLPPSPVSPPGEEFHVEVQRGYDVEAGSLLLRGSLVKSEELPIDLDTVLRLTAERNLGLQQTELDVRLASNVYYRDLAALLPSIVGTYNHTRLEGVIQIFVDQVVNNNQTRNNPQ